MSDTISRRSMMTSPPLVMMMLVGIALLIAAGDVVLERGRLGCVRLAGRVRRAGRDSHAPSGTQPHQSDRRLL